MNRPSNPSTLVVALGLALASMPGLAAEAPRPSTPENRPAAVRADASHAIRMSKLIGIDVHDPQGRKLGEIKDVIMDTSSGRLHYSVLSFGGFLGVGDKLFAIPLAKLRPDGKGRLTLDVTKAALASAPSFDDGRWPDWMTDPHRAEVDKHWAATGTAPVARLQRASEVLEAEVRDANRASIGDIKDIVVDLRDSRVRYVVVEFNRAWNPDDKLVALPMSALGAVATAGPAQRDASAAAPPRSAPGFLSLEAPSGVTKGTATAVDPPGGVRTTPPAGDSRANAQVRPLERPPLGTTTSYAEDEDLLYNGTREQLRSAPAFDRKSYPDFGKR